MTGDPQQTVILNNLPHQPGVYRFLDSAGTVIYVGKAKDLRKRVAQYFATRRYESARLELLVKKIADIQYTVVPTEVDALLLENNLIKKLQPRYNILLKDDKTYPWICIRKEPFPRIFPTRRKIRDGSDYYGPYAAVGMMKVLLELIRQLYPLRTCRLSLTPEALAGRKYKPCLDFHLGRCKAPCAGRQTEQEYRQNIESIKAIIKGNLSEVYRMLQHQMQQAAAIYAFEEAQKIKERLSLLERYQAKSVIVNAGMSDLDVFSLFVDGNEVYCNFLRVVEGAVVGLQTLELRMGIEEEREALLSYFIAEMLDRMGNLSKQLIVPFLPDQELPSVTYIVPQRGDKLKLLRLSERNSRLYKLEKLRQLEKLQPERHAERTVAAIQRDLHLPEPPVHIECFDNSNIQGAFPVSSCVVFRNARPCKRDYRHFNVKTVEGANDFATMFEVVTRRYSRLLEEKQPLPQLVIIDGGKGQLSAACQALAALGLETKITLAGLAKRLEEIYFVGDSVPLCLDKRSATLRLLMQMRDEAHRFGITHHRLRRSKPLTATQLTSIDGIGEKTAEKLLIAFKSVARIKTASIDELQAVAGKKTAEKIKRHYKLCESAVETHIT
ncbi:MAG: excinuclease ABC subunit UvrC [Prevotellaceae bacterium]|jgi:excinuclease ABC subunit C|nr:excinuclease ABC subunit UvrC [Prevotellaceae bacterium]